MAEIAETLAIHRHTVRNWLKAGLAAIDDSRPTLVLGSELKRFLASRRAVRKRRCPPGTIYCVRCREPRRPAGGWVDLRPITATTGDLTGMCPDCEATMFRRVSLASLPAVCADLDVTTTDRESRIGEGR